MRSNVMENLMDLTCSELEKISKRSELDQVSLKNLSMLIDIKKDILEIEGMEEYAENRNNANMSSNNGYGSYDNRGYTGGNSYTNGYSNHGWNRGYVIQPYYANNGMNGSSYGNMGMMNGYSRAGSEEEMKSMLREMAGNVSPEKQNMIHDFLNQFDQMN